MTIVLRNLPNSLTFLRIILIPVFVIVMMDPTEWMQFLAVAIFIVASLTDVIDGMVARRLGAVSDFGK